MRFDSGWIWAASKARGSSSLSKIDVHVKNRPLWVRVSFICWGLMMLVAGASFFAYGIYVLALDFSLWGILFAAILEIIPIILIISGLKIISVNYKK